MEQLSPDDQRKIQSYIEVLKEAIQEDETELRRMERQVKEGMQCSIRTKEAAKKKEYAELLTSDIIPWYKSEIAYRMREIRKSELILSGYSWDEAIRMIRVEEEEEHEPTLF